jgi:hypothetical protein
MGSRFARCVSRQGRDQHRQCGILIAMLGDPS